MNSCDTCWHSFSFSSKSSYQRKWTPRLSVWEATLQDGLLCLLLFVLKQTKENHPGDFLSWPPRCTDVETLLETVGVMIKMLPTQSVNYKDLLENTVSLISFKDTANQHIFKERKAVWDEYCLYIDISTNTWLPCQEVEYTRLPNQKPMIKSCVHSVAPLNILKETRRQFPDVFVATKAR